MALPPLRLPDVNSRYGAPMGRPSHYPLVSKDPIKLRMARMPLVDGCYDRGGAYWGSPSNLYHVEGTQEVLLDYGYSAPAKGIPRFFLRAKSREEAKKLVREKLPNARFYR